MTEEGQEFLDMNHGQLLSHLLQIITKTESQDFLTISSDSIGRPGEVYALGNLGFEPEHVDFEIPKISKESLKASFVTLELDTRVVSTPRRSTRLSEVSINSEAVLIC